MTVSLQGDTGRRGGEMSPEREKEKGVTQEKQVEVGTYSSRTGGGGDKGTAKLETLKMCNEKKGGHL